MPPGSTVMVKRDPSGDEDDRPLSLTIVKPKKQARPKKSKPAEPETVGVGAKKDGGETDGEGEPAAGGEQPSGDGDAS
jgi:hypothetical protein